MDIEKENKFKNCRNINIVVVFTAPESMVGKALADLSVPSKGRLL